MPKKIVAGNWKMNLNLSEAKNLTDEILEKDLPQDVEVIIFPPAVFVGELSGKAGNRMAVGVQNFNPNQKGAFTGELSVDQVKSVGATTALIGHSERRTLFGEGHAFLKQKVNAAIRSKFPVVFCCGEPLSERKAGNEYAFVKQQLEESLFHLTKEEMHYVTIAYEPVWAIGTGETASAEQAEEMHKAIRTWLIAQYGSEVAEATSLLYGGSCKPENAKELFACENVDGGLIGGASLKAGSFYEIITSFG